MSAYVGSCDRGFNPDNPDKPCQDAILMEEHPPTDTILFAVFDGHGEQGHAVAQLLRDALPSALFNSPHFSEFLPIADTLPPPHSAEEALEVALATGSGSGSSGGGGGGAPFTAAAGSGASAPPRAPMRKGSQRPPHPACPPRMRRNVGAALQHALAQCEAALLEREDIDCTLAGTTACIVCVSDGDCVTVANVGDSRAVLFRNAARGGGSGVGGEEEEEGGGGGRRLLPLALSIDHSPRLPSEARRILLAGGTLAPISYEDGTDGPLRVWAPGVVPPGPGLAMTRSVGDTMGKLAGVCAEPDIYTGTLAAGEDAFIVLGSDGLWEFLGGGEVGAALVAAGGVAEAEARGAAGGGGEPPRAQLQVALDALATAAVAKWREAEGSFDDISIIIAEVKGV